MPVAEPGQTRICPHCKATILASADVCPACRHHLRFGAERLAPTRAPTQTLFRVEGTVAPPPSAAPVEYDVVVAVYDEKGVELGRQVVHAGALKHAATRRCVVTIEAHPALAAAMPPPARPGEAPAQRPGSLPPRRGRLF